MDGNEERYNLVSKNMQRHTKIEVTEVSDSYHNKGTTEYYRTYLEVKKSNVTEK